MKIPLILAQSNIPEALPYRQASGNELGGRAATAAAVAQVGADVNTALGNLNKLEQKQRVANAGLEVDEAISKLKDDHDAATYDIREQGNPDTYSQEAQKTFDNLAADATQRLRYPESKMLFQKKLAPMQAETSIKARAEGLRLQHVSALSRASLQDREDANAAVFATTPYDKQQALNRLTERDSLLVRQGVRGTSALPQAYAHMDEATARRDFDNPTMRNQVIAGLTAGQYQYLTPDAQLQLRDALVTKANTEKDTQRKEEKRIQDETADDAQRYIVDTVRSKDYAQANALLTRYGQYMKGEEKKAWAAYIDKAQENRPSDPKTRTDLSIMAYTADTTRTIANAREAVIRAVGNGMLDDKDGDKYLGHLQSMAVADRNRREDKGLDAYHRERSATLDQLKEDLKVTGPLEQLVPQAQQSYALALDDYNRNVPPAAQSGETPTAWYARTKATWIGHVSRAATTRLSEIDRELGPYKDKAALTAARQQFLLPNGEPNADFYDKARLLKQAESIRREMKRLGGEDPADATTKPDAKPGGKSLGFPNQ